MAEALTYQQIHQRLIKPERIAAEAFEILMAVCRLAGSDNESDLQRAQELILRAMENRDQFGDAVAVLDSLVRQVGLFPYLERESLRLADAIAYEFHRPINMEGEGVVFHRVQAEVYRRLLEGDNIILSAPTSFGKSLIIDALVASGLYNHIAIVVPTIALIDETRRRLSHRFAAQYKVITHPSQKRAERDILVMTQERLLETDPLMPIDFFVIDEFYKLQPRAEDSERSLVLNAAFYRLFKTGAKFYLLGPNIQNIVRLPDRIEYRFIQTDYKTVASEVERIRVRGDGLSELTDLCSRLTEPTLIYCSSPNRVRIIAEQLVDASTQARDPRLEAAYQWIAKEYHPQWLLGRALLSGVGIHHGRLPRALSQYVVRAFNEGLVRFLVCTSTLIEGVNTKAKNVIIFDNKIARRKFDYFTYNNILGRSGRMFQHFVGKVFLFHAPPAEELPLVDIPIFTQPDGAPESLLIQIDDDDQDPSVRSRMNEIYAQKELPPEIIKQSNGIDPRAQINLAREIAKRADYYWSLLNWTRVPKWDQLKVTCQMIWRFFIGDNRRRSGVSSGDQLAFRISQFRSQGGLPGLLRFEIEEANGGDKNPDDAVEEAIEFARNWANFSFPRYLLSLERIQRSVFERLGRRPGNYAFFASQIQNWFVDPAIMALDEYGIPIQIGMKLTALLAPDGSLDLALERLKVLDLGRADLSEFERTLVEEARRYI
jgi:hypothetical protein